MKESVGMYIIVNTNNWSIKVYKQKTLLMLLIIELYKQKQSNQRVLRMSVCELKVYDNFIWTY